LIVLMTQRVVRLLAGVSAVTCAAVAAVSLWPAAGHTRVEDRNGDGRPDVWRVYDQQRQLSEVSIDTNFDGRSDVEEYYDRGALVRRESDRDFSDRVDLVEEFDATTHEHVRSVADVDFDGKADLLELFQAGRLVYVKWASQVASASAGRRSASHFSLSSRSADDRLAPLEDPFRGDLAVSVVHIPVGSGGWVGLATSGGLPAPHQDGVGPLVFSLVVHSPSFALPVSASVSSSSPRGPPISRLLA
jgi:hypothetical protein